MLLALDTTTQTMGIALYDGSCILSESIWNSSYHHTVELAPAVQNSIARSGKSIRDIQVVSVATGPGSFTGLRIGVAFAKGMALALQIPIVGIPSLDILVAALPVSDQPLIAVLQAGRNRIVAGWYTPIDGKWVQDGTLKVMTAQELSQTINKPTIICGELDPDQQRTIKRKFKNANLLSPAQCLRRPSFLAELAWEKWKTGQADDPVTLDPQYLYFSDKTLNE